ncbi:hypothetical protein [Mesorhizobium sp. INR15]|uniref:hypothetical protein n=1 Tax=Mesorhizobium sp. INR15 TaxID=2654248 RepID=UPI0018967FCD|nr:hypothetical protein [Mesorhizobium sp. INR15]QPC93433.1 hypothetical protein GA829_24265 [Mesorhizobium sp. INR15]
MFTSNIGRLRFFSYSAALLVVEIVAIVLCIAGTIGFMGLVNSKPGSSREGMAAAILLASLVLVLLRGNIAWRRSRDARGSRWILWSYIVFSALYAVLQAGTILVIDFNNPDRLSGGLNLLGFSILGLWVTLLVAKPAGVDIKELTSVFDFDDHDAPALSAMKQKVYASPAAGASAQVFAPLSRAAPAPSRPAIPGNGRPRPGGFGKRGLV